jgi:CRISPR/Cas system-associated protein endoribonuclease Cas2
MSIEISLGLVWVIIDYNTIYLLGLSYMMLQFILHNWGDDDCIKVLKNCKKALPENGKVLIYELVIDTNGQWAQMMDIMMLTHFESGMERTEKHWRRLIAAAGFSSVNFIELNHEHCLIEVSN